MDKRLIIAIALSALVLFGWSAVTSKMYPVENKQVTTSKTVDFAPVKSSDAMLVQAPASDASIQKLSTGTISNDQLELVYYEQTASVKEVRYKKYPGYVFHLNRGLSYGNFTGGFRVRSTSADSVTFDLDQNGIKVSKTITLKPQYSVDLLVNVHNRTQNSFELSNMLLLGEVNQNSRDSQSQFYDVAIQDAERTQHYPVGKDRAVAGAKFVALRERYFAAIVGCDNLNASAFINRGEKAAICNIGINCGSVDLASSAQKSYTFHIYLGPQDLGILNRINPQWSSVIHFGVFDIISQVLLQILNFLHVIVRNWGVAIILLSVLVFILLFPLTLKQMRSMKEMQILQPKVEAMRVLYKDNPQKMNKEVMELYKEHKVNPLSGCLPLLLQMPIFLALYQALMRSVVIKGASFLWIKDLSEPDKIFVLKQTFPVIGNEINILPVLMAIEMFVQQKFSSAGMKGTSAAEQQKIMLIVMPILFGVIFYHMPAGLVLYWFINSTMMMAYQLRISRAK